MIGAASGFAASFAMDAATGAFLKRQSRQSVRRQDKLAPGGAPALFIRRLAGLAGAEIGVAESESQALVLHRAMTSTWGAISASLVARGQPPMQAALVTTMAALLLVDEGLPVLRIVPPPEQWPAESHARGVVGHLTLGLAIGGLLSVANRIAPLRPAADEAPESR